MRHAADFDRCDANRPACCADGTQRAPNCLPSLAAIAGRLLFPDDMGARTKRLVP